MLQQNIINEAVKSQKVRDLINRLLDGRKIQYEEAKLALASEILDHVNYKLSTTYKNILNEPVKKFLTWVCQYKPFGTKAYRDSYGTVYGPSQDVKQYLSKVINEPSDLDKIVDDGNVITQFLIPMYVEMGNRAIVNDADIKEICETFKNDFYEAVKHSWDYEKFKNKNWRNGTSRYDYGYAYSKLQQEFENYGLNEIDDDNVEILTDLSIFKRKARGEYRYCIALNSEDLPLYFCVFEETGAIFSINYINGNHGKAVRWNQVESECSSLMVFKTWDEARRNVLSKSSKRDGNSIDSFSGTHMSKAERAEFIKRKQDDQRVKHMMDLKKKADENRSRKIIQDKIQTLNDLLNNLRFKTTMLYDDIKQYDPFEEEDQSIQDKQKLVRDCVSTYKSAKRLIDKIIDKTSGDNYIYEWDLRAYERDLGDSIKYVSEKLQNSLFD